MNKEEVIRRNNVKVFGSGTVPMMFAHGFVGDQVLWRLIIPAFKDKYKVVLFDYVGSGNSDSKCYTTEKYSNLEGYAQDVIDICEALGLREVIFVGHSISSMIGLLAHIQQPEYFSKMIFIAPSPCYINHLDYFGGFEKRDLVSMMDQMKDNYKAWAKDIVPLNHRTWHAFNRRRIVRCAHDN